MSPALLRCVVLAFSCAACNATSDRRENGQDNTLLARGVDTRASTYKDPQPPRTSPRAPEAAGSAEDAEGASISAKTRNETISDLHVRVPVEWGRRPSSDPSERPSFVIPGPGGDAELTVYSFPAEGEEGEAAFQRWRAQFSRAEGTPDGGATRVQTMVRGPLKVTLVDMPGATGAQALPDSSARRPGPQDRLLGAIVEGDHQRHFFAAVGPAPTLALWEQAFADFAATFAVGSSP
ncbi:hypothetical protein SAMN02745121_07459 [Nannocystis exedens]|uniref:Lipoprotein n=1 Tax=Nannocystis exedens TaxID=54 RepID=A0A1I2GT23_9BACT|nr:hypothetical protein [Nannocystis exedens]PCC68763.1 hypothetical protein NAEX_01780 [Nannocystis exedens]SFF19806.1 hypothetical protein SAMN02745121_07459 [Nannocystis exedens]